MTIENFKTTSSLMILPKEVKLGSEMAWLVKCSARDTVEINFLLLLERLGY